MAEARTSPSREPDSHLSAAHGSSCRASRIACGDSSDGCRGGVGVRGGLGGGGAVHASQEVTRDSPRRQHGAGTGHSEGGNEGGQEGATESLSSSFIGSGRPAGEQGQDLQGLHQVVEQEGTAAGGDGAECRVSDLGDDHERRPGVQHELGHPRPLDCAQMEANGVDGSSSFCTGDGGQAVPPASSLAVHDVCPGSGCAVGASRRGDQDVARPTRTSADEVRARPVETALHPSCHAWSRGQVQRLKHSIKQARQAIQHLSLVAKCSDHSTWKVLEIFGGSANLSLIARSTGKWLAMEPVDLMYGSDLLSPKEQCLVLSQLDQWEPDLVCLEPPCGPWSSLQSLNPRKDLLELKRALHMPFWTFSSKVWRKQHAAGRLVLLEQPLRSAALLLDCMRDRPSVFRAVVDQCQFELKDPMTHKLYRKRTALDVNSELFAAALMHQGICTHAPHEHEVIEGQTMLDGKWINRSLVAGMWTPCFAKHIRSGPVADDLGADKGG